MKKQDEPLQIETAGRALEQAIEISRLKQEVERLSAENAGLREGKKSLSDCLDYWQARFVALSDVWRSGDNATVLDACMRFVKANDEAPARAKLVEIAGLREDRERIEYLEQNGCAEFDMHDTHPRGKWFSWCERTKADDYHPTLRSAIDAARGASHEKRAR